MRVSKVHILFIVISVAIAWYYLKEPDVKQNLEIQNDKAALQTNTEVANKTAVVEPAPNNAGKAISETKKTREQELREQGFVDDPNNSLQMMKQLVGKDGKKKTIYALKNDEGIEPVAKTAKNAIETLTRKKEIDPSQEFNKLVRMSDSLDEDMMLNGYFRDDENDIENFFSPATDENGNLLEDDVICFFAPKFGFKIKQFKTNASIRTDGTGYGLVKLNEQFYVRVAWSYEYEVNKPRTIHGQIVSLKNGTYEVIKEFSSKEVNRHKGGVLKYCDN